MRTAVISTWAYPAPVLPDGVDVAKIRTVMLAIAVAMVPIVVWAQVAPAVSTEALVVPFTTMVSVVVGALSLLLGAFAFFWRSVRTLIRENREFVDKEVRESREFAEKLARENGDAIGKLTTTVETLGNTMQTLQVQLARDLVPRKDVDEIWSKVRRMDKKMIRLEMSGASGTHQGIGEDTPTGSAR